jgi:hypothetical protein
MQKLNVDCLNTLVNNLTVDDEKIFKETIIKNNIDIVTGVYDIIIPKKVCVFKKGKNRRVKNQAGKWLFSYLCEMGIIENADTIEDNDVVGVLKKKINKIAIPVESYVLLKTDDGKNIDIIWATKEEVENYEKKWDEQTSSEEDDPEEDNLENIKKEDLEEEEISYEKFMNHIDGVSDEDELVEEDKPWFEMPFVKKIEVKFCAFLC